MHDMKPRFAGMVQKACKVHDMASVTDYRRLAHHHRGLFFTDESREEELQARFQEVAQPHATRPIRVDVIMGRTLDVAQAGEPPFVLPLLCCCICRSDSTLQDVVNAATLRRVGGNSKRVYVQSKSRLIPFCRVQACQRYHMHHMYHT